MNFPEFELDEASRRVFTPASFRGQAQHYFRFAPLPGDEEIGVWARLVERREWDKFFNRSFRYRVALWPQGAEKRRVFFVGLRVKDFYQAGESWNFDWHGWQRDFENPDYYGHLGRYWTVGAGEEMTFFRVDASDAAFCDVEESGRRFYWRTDDDTPRRLKDLRFMRVSNARFERQMRALWKDKNSALRVEAEWHRMSEAARAALALELRNGAWDDFVRLLRWVLIARIGREAELKARVSWQVFCYAPASMHSDDARVKAWHNDAFLLSWRAALFDFFRPVYPRNQGFEAGVHERIKSYFVQGHPQTQVVAQPSQHEILEAHFVLRAWAHANLPTEQAAQLMEL